MRKKESGSINRVAVTAMNCAILNNRPPTYPPARPKPTVYNETWELAATNVVLRGRECWIILTG